MDPKAALSRRQKDLVIETDQQEKPKNDIEQFLKNRSRRFEIRDNQYVLCEDDNLDK